MARSVVLGNGGLTVGLDEKGRVHDFYYPYVGLENLSNARLHPHYLGIWVDGTFSWLHEDSWQTHITFSEDALISECTYANKDLHVEIHIEAFVDAHHNVFARKVAVKNESHEQREVRLFFHQIFQISSQGRADTVMFVPDGPYILDYKGRTSILAYAETDDGTPFDQHAVGNAGIEGKEGTFRDAEDGELSNSAVEHGGVDSVLRVSLVIDGTSTRSAYYWLAVADSQHSLEKLHRRFKEEGVNDRNTATKQMWREFLSIGKEHYETSPPEYQTALKKSLMIIKAHTDKHGGVIASCDSSIYNYGRDYYSYVWPRDGAFVMWPLIRLGHTAEPERFFEFCRSIMTDEGYLMHKYQPDRAIGSTWHPLIHGKRKELAIQEDETAIVLFMLGEYYDYSKNLDFIQSMYDSFVVPTANFMAKFIDSATGLPHASYDLWEEKFLTNFYTAAVVKKALETAVRLTEELRKDTEESWTIAIGKLRYYCDTFFDKEKGIFVKGFLLEENGTLSFDKTLDISSFYGAFMFDYFMHNNQIDSMVHVIEKELLNVSPSGGSARYEHDQYFASKEPYKGNPWFVTTLWLAQFYVLAHRDEEAKQIVDWTLSHALPSGVLSEQVNPQDGHIVGVTPLVWSHAELINTILDLQS